MLKKENRLTKKKDFENVFKNGKGVKQGFLYLKFKKNKLNIPRFGLVVGKNFSKKANQRNKTRRRIREIIKNNCKVDKGMDIVIIVNPGINNEFKELEQSLIKLFEKIK